MVTDGQTPSALRTDSASLSAMGGFASGGIQRSGLYSSQKFTNWTPHDPYWSEVDALPGRCKPVQNVPRIDAEDLPIYDRPLSPGFVRPCSVQDILEVLVNIPGEYLIGLRGVFLMAGTAKQARRQSLTYGIYANDTIYLFPISQLKLENGIYISSKAWDVPVYERFGFVVEPSQHSKFRVRFSSEQLRSLFLYDVLLHEIGHHIEGIRRSGESERYARWFAEFQAARLKNVDPDHSSVR